MPRMIFVNLPVKDLNRSKEFFGKLGFGFNEQFTNDQAAYMEVNDKAAVMLVTEPFFKTFTDKKIADPKREIEVSNAISAESRDDVDRLVETAARAGATTAANTTDEGFMYSRGFYDPDGHHWDVVWMDPKAIAG